MLRLRCRRWPEPQCASESELWPYGAVGGFPPPVRKKMRWEAPTMRAPVVILRSRRISYWRRLGLTIRCPWLASRPAVRLDNRVLHPTGDRDVLNATKHIGNDTATNRVAQMLL